MGWGLNSEVFIVINFVQFRALPCRFRAIPGIISLLQKRKRFKTKEGLNQLFGKAFLANLLVRKDVTKTPACVSKWEVRESNLTVNPFVGGSSPPRGAN